MADEISLRELGRRLDVSVEAVRKAIATGRIPASAVGETKLSTGKPRKTIKDVDAAIAGFRGNADPSQVRDKAALSAAGKRAYAERTGQAPPPADDEDSTPAPTMGAGAGGARGIPSITESRAIKAAYDARTARLEYEEKAGKLVNADLVKLRFTQLVTDAKQRLLGVPSKAKGAMPWMTVDDIERLEDLIAEALNELAVDDGR